MLWEMSISFSARCSIDQYESNMHAETCHKGAVYVDKIRIWNISFKTEQIPKMIEQILFSHKRGRSCLIQKQLKGIKQEPLAVNNEKLPNIYVNEGYAKEYLNNMVSQTTKLNLDSDKYLFFPPANPNDQEYNILKFYAFTSAMASRVLTLTKSHIDFPFQVSELEHTIIHLEPNNTCAVLLLGRSGTGKTTCCLYRLFKHYQSYWNTALHAGPHLPKFKYPIYDKDAAETPEEERQAITDEFVGNFEQREDYVLVPCLCNDKCSCQPIYAPRNGGSFSRRSSAVPSCSKYEPPESIAIREDDEEDEEENNECEYEHLRQLLITKNEVLCNEIKKNFSELCVGCPNAKFEPSDPKEYADIKNIPAEKYPMFITSKDLLVLLDGSLQGTPFFERDKNGFMVHDIPGWGKNKVFLSFLPLGEEDDMQHDDDDDDDVLDEDLVERIDEKLNVTAASKTKEITYDVFAQEIWPQISKANSGQCHPSLVWMEIKSFIKGSAESFLNENGQLSKEEYLTIGRKKAPNFTGSREDIYDLFLLYSKVKAANRYFDEMDVHFNIYKRLKTILIPDWAFHQVYVDETQDFTQGELLLLLRCSLNQNAMFFSGDTAQSIINGVSFRFCDLKSLFLIAKQEFERNKITSPVIVPRRVHQLTHNYRSHSGILKLASSVVRLLELFFPESFDRLNPDIGLFTGPKPVILDTNDFSELAMLLQGTKRETSAIEFGAHQVVLVQNDKSKEGVPPELSCGLVLSIYEAKGLEFDDVLLYNFFKDSPAVDEWRVIASNIDNIEESEGTDSSLRITLEEQLECETRALDFDYNKHKLLNSELKKLYTAITRARVNVWIFDEDKKKRAPIFEMFVLKGLVNVMKLEVNSPEQRVFAERSSDADWKRQGHRFYEKSLWKLAMKCFESGKDEVMLRRCEAQMQGAFAEGLAREWKVKKTQRILVTVLEEFRKAAKMFLENSLIEEAKVCLRNLKAWRYLGKICEKQNDYASAALYYYKEPDHFEVAIRCFKHAGKYKRAIRILYERERYFQCLDLIEEFDALSTDHKDKSFAALWKKAAAEKACREFYDYCQFDEMKRALKYLTYEDQFKFLKVRRDCNDILIQLYKDYNKTNLLVAYYLDLRMFSEAAEVEVDPVLKARYILMAVRLRYIQEWKGEDTMILEKIGVILESLDYSHLSTEGVELKFDLLYHKMRLLQDFTGIRDVVLHYHRNGDVIMMLVCLFCWVQYSPSSISESLEGVGSVLRLLIDFIKKVFGMIRLLVDRTSSQVEDLFALLGLRKHSLSEKECMVEDETRFMYYMKFGKVQTQMLETFANGITVSVNQVGQKMARFFLKLLQPLITNVQKELKSNMTHAIAMSHPSHCSFSGCNVSHGVPSAITFVSGMDLVVSSFELMFVCVDEYVGMREIMIFQNDVKWLDPANAIDGSMLRLFCGFVYSYVPFLHVLRRSNILETFTNIPSNVRTILVTSLRQVWQKLLNKNGGYMDINAYMKLSFLAYLLDPKRPVIDELLATDSGRYSMYKDHYKKLYQWNQYLENLYYKHHVVSASKDIYNVVWWFFGKVTPVKPILLTICELLELPIMILLLSLAKINSTSVYFPDTCLAYLNLCNSLYSAEGQAGIVEAVKMIHAGHKQNVINFLYWFVSLLAGKNPSRINPISNLSQELASFDSEKKEVNSLEQLQCERLLILYLIILGNYQPEMQGARLIIDGFRSQVLRGEGKLAQLFNTIPSLQDAEDARKTLEEFLKWKNGKLIKYDANRVWKLKTHVKVQHEAPGREWKIVGRRGTEESDEETIDNVGMEYSGGYEIETKVQEDQMEELNEESSVINNEDAEFRKFNEAEFSKSGDMPEGFEGGEFDDLTGAEKDELNEPVSEHKMEKERWIKESMAATFIRNWWKRVRTRRRKERDIQKDMAAKKIQIWWKKIILKMQSVQNQAEQSIFELHAEYFDSNNICVACDKYVGPSTKESHLKEASPHHQNVETYKRFQEVSDSLMELHEKFDEYKEEIGEANIGDEDIITFDKINMNHAFAKQKKKWNEAEKISLAISNFVMKMEGATESADQPEEDEFEEVTRGKNKSKYKRKNKKGKGKKKR